MLQEMLAKLVDGENLSRKEAARAMQILMEGEATHAQIGALLVAMRMKGETVDEITGFAETMRRFATRIQTRRSPLIDTCGTGGDRSGTFNISTAAAFVAAGAGVCVAKHGNRSASSLCGSADVLEALGVNIDATPETVGRCIDTVGIGFLFARSLHGAMRHVAVPRIELRLRTIFNILGPLTNPAGADGQVMGIFDAALVEPMAQVLANLNTRHAFVVAGADGLDEISLSGPTHVAEAHNGAVSTYVVTPEQFDISPAPRDALTGGDAARNAEILRAVLAGSSGPPRDVVVLNAAAGIVAGMGAADWAEGIEAARQSIDSGAAQEKLQELVKVSHDS